MNQDTFLNPIPTDDSDYEALGYEIINEQFYPLSLVEGKKFRDKIEKNIKYYANEKKLFDFYTDPVGTFICNEKSYNLISEFEKKIQILNTPLFGAKTKKKINGYKILNFLNSITCLDKKESKYSSYDGEVSTPVINEKLVPKNAYAFWIKEAPYRLYFRRELALAIRNAKMTGIMFLKTKSH